jgi:hypothetical protein
MSAANQPSGAPTQPVWRRRDVWIGVGGAVLLAAAIAAAPRVSAAASGAAVRGLLAHGATHGGHALLLEDPERARERAAFAAEWVLRGVDATPQQTELAKQRASQLVDELLPIAERHRGNREAIAAALVAPQLDRNALEQLRANEMALADDASRVVVDAIADLGDILTPAQRAELLELAHRAHELHQR